MKNSTELKTLNETVRKEILNSYKNTITELIAAYKKAYEDVDTDGYISLPTGVILVHSEDDESMIVLERIHTNGKIIETVQNYSTDEINIDDISNENVIFIISQIEEMINNPQTIDIEP